MQFAVKRFVSGVAIVGMLLSSTVVLKTNADAPSTMYAKYVYGTSEADGYELVHNELDVTVQSRGEVGIDDRKIHGCNGVVRLEYDDGWRGTGFIVGDHVIATAAHCVYDIGNADWASTDNFVPNLKVQMYDSEGHPTTTKYSVNEVHIPADYYATGNTNSNMPELDYALLVVSEDLSGYPHFNLGIAYDESSNAFDDIDLYVTGIPSRINNGATSNSNGLVYTGKGNIHDSTVTGMIYYTCDTSGGNSGGPVYTANKYTMNSTEYTIYTAIAIHCGGEGPNRGVKIDSEKLQFYMFNPNIG